MIKSKIIRIDIKGGEDMTKNILFFDKEKQCYYVMTPEILLGKQNKIIEDLEQKMRDHEQRCNNTVKRIQDEFNELVKNNKKLNAKLIDMVEKFINGGKE